MLTAKTRTQLLDLLCLLPNQNAPAKASDLAADMGVSQARISQLLSLLQTEFGITTEHGKGNKGGIWISPASWKKAQRIGMEHAERTGM